MYEDFVVKRLTALRQKKGVSARAMSLDIGQNESYINRIENGLSSPSLSGLFYICEYLGITPSEFFDEENHEPERLRKIQTSLRKLNSQELEAVEMIVRALLRAHKN